MKKLLSFFVILSAFVCNSFCDSFTDAIQDLAIQTACIGQYSATQAGGGWYDDPHDYYTPQMMAERFKNMSGNMTRTTTFYGVCFDYAQFAWQDVDKYKKWYNDNGMYEGQFWIAGVHADSNTIILSNPTTKDKATTVQNGVYIRTYPTSNRSVKTHRGLTGDRAIHHAWLWIERADGIWFWIDPTWTDNLGYVVYGYVKNGEEIQCRPNKDFCINYPSYLDNLPSPPPMGNRITPSKTANSTNREETINDAGTEWITEALANALDKTFLHVDYSNMNNTYIAFLATVDIPFSIFSDNSLILNKIGFGVEMPLMLDWTASLLGVEYLHNLDDENNLHAVIFEINFVRRLMNNFSWYIGGGAGLRFDFSNDSGVPRGCSGIVNTGYFAWKADTGLIINISRVFTKIEVSYNNVFGFSLGAGVGFGIEL